ncbi:MAG: ISAs1 family transposase [Anaerolineales bacterium]|nr:ISAs1 family transposase [Chloroflexota bacterium]MBL6981964.1 ISAs1 family transposase [Anaerolineales bacterium]
MECNTEEGFIFDIGSLYEQFHQLTDSRDARGLRYPLEIVLTLAVMGKLCGEDRPIGIAEWAEHRAAMLVEALGLERSSMPHHSTYRRIFEDVVDASELDQMVGQYLAGKKNFGQQVVLAIDGKFLKGTVADDKKGLHLLAAYLPCEGIVLMQMTVENHENEIPVAPKLLKCLDLRDKVIIGDAMHTQREVSLQIVVSGGDYIWFAKGNQSNMEDDIRLWFGPDAEPIPGMSYPPKDFESATTVNKGHGRIEKRAITVSSQLKDFFDWPYLEQVFKLERRFIRTKTGEVQEHIVYGFTSLSREAVSPKKLLNMVRSYWRIENSLHYRRDVSLLEDRTRMTKGHAGQVMASINNLVLGIFAKKYKFQYLPSARRYFDAHPLEALALITRL